jgi:hypothetical protein
LSLSSSAEGEGGGVFTWALSLVSPTKDWSGPVHPAPLHSSEVLTAVIKASRVPADQ